MGHSLIGRDAAGVESAEEWGGVPTPPLPSRTSGELPQWGPRWSPSQNGI